MSSATRGTLLMEYNWQFKTVLIGDGAVGKTSIRRNYMKEGFKTTHIPTIGVDFAKKLINFYGEIVRFVIWDLAGQHSFERVRGHYYQGAQSIVLVYSVMDRESFDNASKWLVEAYRHLGKLPPTAILANKVDLRQSDSDEDIVTTMEGLEFVDYFKRKLAIPAIFRETSALTGYNINETFNELIRMMMRNTEDPPPLVTRQESQTQEETE
ncbi:MAG: GTP-binding protein [Candidatus Thorarchaeota archaeon]|nr:MAG: GTP-binding protein [Candidatus Thorarchaeota archaeon]